MNGNITDRLDDCPIIGAVRNDKLDDVLKSPVEIIFHLDANLLTVAGQIRAAHAAGKLLFVHIDLAEGIGRDGTGLKFLKNCGVDGIISTRSHIIRCAKESGLFTVQRFFALDSQGVESIDGILDGCRPDMTEIMPGVVYKIIERLSKRGIPVIAGGLIETKQDVTLALSHGARAVSTGKKDLWYI